MPELDIWFFMIAGPAVLFAGISKGGFGSGAAFAGSSILAIVLEPGLALGVMLPLLMLIDAGSLRPYWGQWRWREGLLMIVGAVPGVALGAWFYTLVDADSLRILLAVICFLFVFWQLAQRAGLVPVAGKALPDWVGGITGVVVGFTSFVSHAGGPPAAVYMLSQRMKKLEYQATSVLVFGAVNICKAVPYGMLGLFTWETLEANVYLAPFALLGTWIGVRLHKMIPEQLFFNITYCLLAITGSKLLWDGLV